MRIVVHKKLIRNAEDIINRTDIPLSDIDDARYSSRTERESHLAKDFRRSDHRNEILLPFAIFLLLIGIKLTLMERRSEMMTIIILSNEEVLLFFSLETIHLFFGAHTRIGK